MNDRAWSFTRHAAACRAARASGMLGAMQYGAWGWGLGGLLMAAACGETGGNGAGDESFGGGTQVGTNTGVATTTGTPTTGATEAATTGEPSSPTSVTTADVSTTGVPTTGDDTGTTTTTTTTTGPSTGDESSGTGTTGEEACAAPGLLLVCDGDSEDPFHALGLGCEGAPENTIAVTNKQFKSQKVAYRSARGFGKAMDPVDPDKLLFAPKEGERLLVISTGVVAELDADGYLIETAPQFENNNNFNNDDPNSLPAPMSPQVGSNNGQGGTPSQGCDGVHDCSDSIEPNWTLGNGDPNDMLWASFEVVVPAGTHGFGFDVAYFSSEYPDFVGKKFNDMFIGWSTSEAYTGNVTFFNSQPFTVTALAAEMESSGFVGDDPALLGTGFEGHGSTGWVTINAPAEPGESLTFALAIMDMGDSNKATLAVVDHWHWSCVGCVPVESDPSCGQDDHPACCGVCVELEDDPKCNQDGHPVCCVEPG